MTTIPIQSAEVDDLISRPLLRLRQQRWRVLSSQRIVEGLILAWALAWSLWTLDALWPIGSPWIRLVLALTSVVVLIAAWRSLLQRAWVQTGSIWGLAQQIEVRQQCHDQPLINALWLSHSLPPAVVSQHDDPLWQALVQRAIQRGSRTLAQIDGSTFLPTNMLKRRLLLLGILLGVTLLAMVLWPVLFLSGWLRWADPFGDHPPVSRTYLSLKYDPPQPTYGQDVLVIAQVAGRPVDTLMLVEIDSQGQPATQTPMQFAQPGIHQRRLIALREPVTLRAEGGGTWSRPVTIQPGTPDTQNPGTVSSDPAATTSANGDHASSDGAGRPIQAATMAALTELSDALARLANHADQLRQASEASSADSAAKSWLDEQARLLEQRLAGLASRARWHEQWFAQHAAEDARLAESARAMGQLRTPRLAQSQLTSGQSPGGVSDSGQLVFRAGQVQQAAELDQQILAQLLGQWTSAAAGKVATGAGHNTASGSDLPATLPSTARAGTTTSESQPAAGTRQDQGLAWVQSAVPRYREWVGRYYWRISEDELKFKPKGVQP